MPCCKSAHLPELHRTPRWRCGFLLVALALLLALLAPRPGQAEPAAQLQELRVEEGPGGYDLYAQIQLALPDSLRAALKKGIAIYFETRAEIQRPRWYWKDERLASAVRVSRLSYQPLTRRWRLHVSDSRSGRGDQSESGLGLSPPAYDSLDEALAAVQRIAGWHIADADVRQAGEGKVLHFAFYLDSKKLPRTLQLGGSGGMDWQLDVRYRLDLDGRMPEHRS